MPDKCFIHNHDGLQSALIMTPEQSHNPKRSDRGQHRSGPRRDRPDRRPDDKRGQFKRDSRGRNAPRRDGNRDFKRSGDRKEFRGREGQRRNDRPPRERPERPKMYIPDDPQKLLFKGADFQAKGDTDKAMIMFLHGSVLMSKGCENSAVKILESVGKDGFADLRTRISEFCSDDALIELDYLCQKAEKDYVCEYLEKRYSEKNPQAVYRMICMDRVDGEDDIIDVFASGADLQKITDGMKLLVKRRDSKKAESHLKALDEKKERKQYVHTAFTRAMKGDAKSKRDLEKLSKEFPEAAFFLGYVKAREEGNGIPWLKEKYPQFSDLIIAEEFNLRIGDTDYGMYLRAMKLKSKKEDWIPSMIKAAKYGSQEAMDELQPLMYRIEIKKAVANIHLNNSDLQGLVADYAGGLDETYYLDKYCENVPDKIVEAGKRIGDVDPMREIDWLRAHAFMVECRDALVTKMDDDKYHSRKLLYALHDVGRNMEAADLYFAMEGHPDLPAVKWLAKVCRDEDAKEYIRSHFESKGDLETFEYIFVDDGYKKRPKNFRRR